MPTIAGATKNTKKNTIFGRQKRSAHFCRLSLFFGLTTAVLPAFATLFSSHPIEPSKGLHSLPFRGNSFYDKLHNFSFIFPSRLCIFLLFFPQLLYLYLLYYLSYILSTHFLRFLCIFLAKFALLLIILWLYIGLL